MADETDATNVADSWMQTILYGFTVTVS